MIADVVEPTAHEEAGIGAGVGLEDEVFRGTAEDGLGEAFDEPERGFGDPGRAGAVGQFQDEGLDEDSDEAVFGGAGRERDEELPAGFEGGDLDGEGGVGGAERVDSDEDLSGLAAAGAPQIGQLKEAEELGLHALTGDGEGRGLEFAE